VVRWKSPEISPWRPSELTIPPDSLRAWVRLGIWELWMGVLLYVVVGFGTQLIAAAPRSIVTVFDFTNCYAVPPIGGPCERIAYRAGALNAVLNAWCGLLLIAVGAWLLWELWTAVAPKPITDDFLKLLDDSFGHNWRSPRTWPWARMAWAYGFALVGVSLSLGLSMAIASVVSSTKAPTVHVETSQRFRFDQ